MREQKWLELTIYREDLECLDDTERKNLQKNVLGHADLKNVDNCVEKITINKQIGLIEIESDSNSPENESEQAGTELCQAQLKLTSSLFCFRLSQPTALELD